ncbi:MAG: alanine:cation symporter family protein [Bergeyella sp.]|nr:alanine:cation symporter family protein [Bergeyella sp.]
METYVKAVNDIIWSDLFIALCVITGIYFSVKMRFPQVRYIGEMWKLLFFESSSSEKGISSFQAFAIAISGRVGTGNIAGVATAIGMGGPGAVFWMWAIAFLGSASAIVEAALGQMYKEVRDGQYRGGPAFYIEKGLKLKWYAVAFAIVTVMGTGLFLPGVQSNSIAVAVKTAFNIPRNITGIVVVFVLGLIIFGGVRRIAKVAEYLVPFMAGGYILMALIIIGINYEYIPSVFKLIFSSAFGIDATFGGIVGAAISWGVKRGVYSNEAGQGSAPHAAAAAEVSHPMKQGLIQGFSVYIDTLFVCTATALVILFTGMYNVEHPSGRFIVEHLPGVAKGAEYTQFAVSYHFSAIGSSFVAISLFFFAFTTIMAYYYIAETNVSYLQGKNKSKAFINIFRAVILFSTYYGAIKTSDLAWGLGDIGVGLMAWLNIIALWLLQKKAFSLFKDYEKQRKEGKDPTFDFSCNQ